MSYDPHDTICAVATAAGGAARGIVRISGQHAVSIVGRLFHADDGAPFNHLGQATAIAGQVVIDAASSNSSASSQPVLPVDLFIWPTSRSYTREPVAELHTIGSPPLLDALTVALCNAGARLAEPGEFTLRAFLAGRIDLTQAEAVLGVIDAHGDTDLQAALAQLAGGLARPLQSLRDDLLQLLAELEAGLDFVDDDIEFVSHDETRTRLAFAGSLLAEVAQQMESRSMTEPIAQVALVGHPNVGKSSLFNALVERLGVHADESRQRLPALVSAQRGTTRDYLTALVDLDGMQCELVDTAGVDVALATSAGTSSIYDANQNSSIDEAAQLLAHQRRAAATIRLHCVDASDESATDPTNDVSSKIVVLTKCDVNPHSLQSCNAAQQDVATVITSSRTGEGLDQLTAAIRRRLQSEPHLHGQVVGRTADRCRESIRLARSAIERASDIAADDGGHELIAAEIRIALAELGKVVGVVYTDDLLDRIFSTFCIGK